MTPPPQQVDPRPALTPTNRAGLENAEDPAKTITGTIPPSRLDAITADSTNVRFVFRELPQDIIDVGGSDCRYAFSRIRVHDADGAGERATELLTANAPGCAAIVQPHTPPRVTAGGPWPPEPGLCGGLDPDNVIHTSHTIQDIPNLDLTWLRSYNHRAWTCFSTAYWRRDPEHHAAWTGDGPDWWNSEDPRFVFVDWFCKYDSLAPQCLSVVSKFAAKAETTVAVCDWWRQDDKFFFTTKVTAYGDGSRDVDYKKVGSCIGLHSATETKQNDDINSNYGGIHNRVYSYPPPGT